MTYTNKVTTLDITSNYGNSDRQHALRSTHKNWAFREDAEVKEPAMDSYGYTGCGVFKRGVQN